MTTTIGPVAVFGATHSVSRDRLVEAPTGSPFRLDSYLLVSGVHQLLLSADAAVYVPLLVHTLVVAKDRRAAFAAVLHHLIAARLMPSDGVSVIRYPISCAEPWARFQLGQVSDSVKSGLTGDEFA